MLSLGGFFLALLLGDIILGWAQSQPAARAKRSVRDCVPVATCRSSSGEALWVVSPRRLFVRAEIHFL